MKNTNKGFTLVELIVVITILAILGTIAFISLQGYSQDAKNSKVVSDTRTIVTAIETKLTEAKAGFTMSDVVTNASADNEVAGTVEFASGVTLDSATTYSVGDINFTTLRQNGADFKDNDGNDYIAAVAVKGENAFYQVAGQQTEADGSFTAVVKGNFIKLDDADGLIDTTAGGTNGIVNGTTITTLY